MTDSVNGGGMDASPCLAELLTSLLNCYYDQKASAQVILIFSFILDSLDSGLIVQGLQS